MCVEGCLSLFELTPHQSVARGENSQVGFYDEIFVSSIINFERKFSIDFMRKSGFKLFIAPTRERRSWGWKSFSIEKIHQDVDFTSRSAGRCRHFEKELPQRENKMENHFKYLNTS